jgi:hypothetical protein
MGARLIRPACPRDIIRIVTAEPDDGDRYRKGKGENS